MLSYTDARQKVIEVAGALPRPLVRTHVEIEQAFGRILAEPVLADRDYPPFDRSTRDGFAVRAADAQNPGARLECVGELRAGGRIEAAVLPGQCVEIMTGAAIPCTWRAQRKKKCRATFSGKPAHGAPPATGGNARLGRATSGI
jgi:molybdopterin molybdotransferase